MNPADLWELLTKNGIAPDSATAIVQTHAGMNDADLWERLTKNGASSDAATSIVKARGPQEDTSINLGNLGRSAMQGATFNFGDKIPGLNDPAKQKAFQAAHPIANALGEIAGGSVAPILAATALPALATGGGALAMMGGVGALSGAGSADPNAPPTMIYVPGTGMVSLPPRIAGAVTGGVTSLLAGKLGQKVFSAAQPAVSSVLDRINPSRVVARVSKGLLDDPAGVAARMAEANAIAPGSASIMSSEVAREGTDQSRFLPLVRGIAANPEAARAAEAQIVGQRAAIDAGKKAIGEKMNALAEGEITLTPKVRQAMSDVKSVLGGKAPDVAPPSAVDANPLGLEKSVPFEFDPQKTTMSLTDARDALSRLRYLARQAARRGVDANGVTEHDITLARRALQDVVYKERPDFAPIDREYSILSDHEAQTEDALAQLQRSRANHGATTAYGDNPASPGAAIVSPKHYTISSLLSKFATDKAAVADAVNRMVVTPGASVQSLLSQVPKAVGPSAGRTGLLTAAIPGMRGLLTQLGSQ